MGREQFEEPINLKAQELTLVDSKISQFPVESVEFIDATATGSIASGNQEDTVVSAPAGYLYDILGMKIRVAKPTGAASGTHTVIVKSELQAIDRMYGQANYDTTLIYNFSYWRQADSIKRPTTEIAQLEAARQIRIDETNGLQLRYINGSDVSQGNDREYYLWVRKVKVA